jgi:hypothetical protein
MVRREVTAGRVSPTASPKSYSRKGKKVRERERGVRSMWFLVSPAIIQVLIHEA